MQLTEINDRQAWDSFVTNHPQGHPLQLWGWGEAKRRNRWVPYRLALMDGEKWVAGLEIMLWPIPKLGRFIAYVPRGPVVEPGSSQAKALLEAIVAWAKTHKVLYVRIEPAWVNGKFERGWRRAQHHLQLSETYTIDLAKPEDELLAVMSHKHRQYIRKSERDGVGVVRVEGSGIDVVAPMFKIYAQTAMRAGFGIHGEGYYRALHEELGPQSYLYYARYQGEPVAFLWLAAAGSTAYELYGGVTEVGQAMKANYFLKWSAMQTMKADGYKLYDFNGRLNEGVSRFKEGFGPDETDYIGTWDYPLNAAGYHVWEHLWPVVKVVGRKVASLRR